MLRLNQRSQFTRPVVALQPKGSGVEEVRFSATFQLLDVDEFSSHDIETATGTYDLLCAAIVSLSEIEGEDGPLPYSPEVRDQVLALPHARKALFRAYIEAISPTAASDAR